MAIEYNRENVGSGYSRTPINNNFQKIDDALDGALSRFGVAPNQMEADFDLNSNDILNGGTADFQHLLIDGVPVAPGNIDIDPASLLPPGGLTDQALVKNSNASYDVDWKGVVLDTGDIMTGDLTIQKTSPSLRLNKTASGQVNGINTFTNDVPRWSMQIGDDNPEVSTSTGSDFRILRYDNVGAFQNIALHISRASGDVVLTGNLNVSKSNPFLILNKVGSGEANGVLGTLNGIERWRVYLGDTTTESGGNVGSDLAFLRFNDAGSFVAQSLTIKRDTGVVELNEGKLKFPITQSPSSDANTLDDYEEGSWVPDLRFGGNAVGMTYLTRNGRYTKIGNRVDYWGYLRLTAKGSSTGVAQVSGLPFVSSAAVSFFGGNMGFYGGTTGITNAGCAVVGGGQFVNLYSLPGNVWFDTNFINTTELVVAGSYQV